ncbi:hypothetical protein D3C80_2187920 [compost metagenome]
MPNGGIRNVTVMLRSGPISAISRKYKMYAHAVQTKPTASTQSQTSGCAQVTGASVAEV